MAKLIPFVKPNKKLGLEYKQPVLLSTEQGVSYGGTEGEAFDYEPAISGSTKEAVVKGAEMVMRGRLSLGALSRSEVGDQASFGRATKHVVQNLLNSSYKKHEYQLWYGGMGLAVVGSVSGNDLFIAQAEWAPAIWAGAEKMRLTSYTGAAVSNAEMSIQKVDIKNRKITVDSAAGVLVGDKLFEFGAYGKEFMGVHKIISTQSGPIFNIETSNYALWQGNVYDNASAPLSFASISEAVAQAVAKGLEGTVSLFVNPRTWSDLLTEQTAQRRFKEGGMVEYSNGAETIKFFSQNGTIEIMASPFVKEGYAFGLQLDAFERVGSADITFKVPGLKEGEFMKHLENSNAVEFRTYSDAALFCNALSHQILITGINNG